MTFLIILCLLFAAVLYAVFFLVFKVIWLLFRSKRNRWPLILAGVATLGIITVMGITLYQLQQRFLRPFAPIIETAKSQTQPVYGTSVYIDPRYGFTFTLYNSTVPSEWIDLSSEDPISLLAAFDTNVLLTKTQTDFSEFAGYLLIHFLTDETISSKEQWEENLSQIQSKHGDNPSFRMTSDLVPVYAGPGVYAAYATGMIYGHGTPQGLPVKFLTAIRGHEVYLFFGFGENNVEETVKSFRLPAL